MEIKSIQGNILFNGRFATLRRAVEAAVRDRVDLAGADLRRAFLRHAVLDGARLAGACLWGARLDGAQMAGGDFIGVDFRTAHMKEACLAESVCTDADFRGAYVPGLIVRDADFSGARFSCPTVFTVPWEEAASLDGAVYWHRGETACPLSRRPIVVSGLPRRVVVMQDHVLIGGDLFPVGSSQFATQP